MKKNINNLKVSSSGFTLVEILFSISVFILIMLALTLLGRNIFIYNSFISTGLSDIDAGRKAIKTMTAEIRTASAANTGAYAISQATGTTFTFYSDIYDNGLKERVRYFLNGSLLQKGVTIPTGSPLAYDLATEKVTTLLSNVTNTTVFNYYDKNYDGTSTALAFPVDVSAVRLIKINITVDKDPNRPPAPTIFSTQISLRNLKDNL